MSATCQTLESVDLVSAIFSYLREKEGRWKGPVADLAVVNVAFFHASVSVVWEEMDSLEPFCCLLFPKNGGHEAASRSSGGLMDGDMERFDFYSKKTKSLILNETPSLIDNPCWAVYLGACKAYSNGLFPSLKSLFLNTADPLSLFIAFSVGPRIRTLSIFLDPATTTEGTKKAIVAFTSDLSRYNRELDRVQIIHPIEEQSFINLSAIKSIRHVFLAVDTNQVRLVMPILCIPRAVEIIQSREKYKSKSYVFLRGASIQQLQSPDAYHHWHYRRTLAVSGSSQTHSLVAGNAAGSTASHHFDAIFVMEYFRAGSNYDPLTPSLIAKYLARRSQGVRSLSVQCEERKSASLRILHPAAIQRIRLDVSFRDVGPLINQLRASKSLTNLRITNILFPAGDIIIQMIQ